MLNLHLDTAAAGRCSTATLQAAASHAEREAVAGAYVAQQEAGPVLEAGRASLAELLGVPAGGLAFAESASAARRQLLSAWPLRDGDTVAVAPSEWGPSLTAFTSHGLQLAELAVHGDGTVDLEHLERFLATAPPAFVHLTQVASHRALVQPVAKAAALCRAAGVPLWVDAAQAVGHVDTACGADAVYATSRKWLTGPRGVGMLAVAEAWWERLRISASPLARSGLPGDASPVRLLEPGEAHIAGRAGLAAAVRQHLAAGPALIRERLAEVGVLTRRVLGDLPGWAVVDEAGAGSAITALRATEDQDVTATRARLLTEHQIVTTAAGPARAPGEMTEPLLRISPHVDCTEEDLSRLRLALAAAAR
jgi:pyridoxal 5-phosphate dependent beta-lyase